MRMATRRTLKETMNNSILCLMCRHRIWPKDDGFLERVWMAGYKYGLASGRTKRIKEGD